MAKKTHTVPLGNQPKIKRREKAPEQSWFDSHIEVIGLSDDINAKIKAKIKEGLAEKLS